MRQVFMYIVKAIMFHLCQKFAYILSYLSEAVSVSPTMLFDD